MTAQIHLKIVPTAPTAVERELANLVANGSQSNLAETVGLADHSPLSKRLAKFTSGKVDAYGDAITWNQGLKLACAHAPLGAEAIAYLSGEQAAPPSTVPLTVEVLEEINADAVLIAKCTAALKDGKISPKECRDLSAELDKVMARHRTLRAHLSRKQGG